MMEFVIVSNPKLVQVHTQFVKSIVPVEDVGFSLYIYIFYFILFIKNFKYFVF